METTNPSGQPTDAPLPPAPTRKLSQNTIVALVVGLAALLMILIIVVLVVQDQAGFPPRLVSRWAAEGDARDGVGTNHGQLQNGAGFAPGKVGQAFSFTGGSAHVRIPDAPELRFTNAMTLEAWINPSVRGGFNSVISKWDAVGGLDQRAYVLELTPTGQAHVGFSTTGDDSGAVTVTSSQFMPINQWTHLAGTYDGTSLKLYVDGAPSSELPTTGKIFPGTDDLGIGAAVGGMGAGGGISVFQGLVDEASVYNRALTGDEVKADYQAGMAGKSALAGQPKK